jgi:hypothetical protein
MTLNNRVKSSLPHIFKHYRSQLLQANTPKSTMSTPYTKETTCRKVEAISPGKQIVTNFESTSQYEQPVAHLKTTSQAKQFIANFTLEQYPATRNFGMERGMQNGYHLLLAGILLCSGLESLDAKQHHLELETIAKSISTVFPIAVSVEDIADHARQVYGTMLSSLRLLLITLDYLFLSPSLQNCPSMQYQRL